MRVVFDISARGLRPSAPCSKTAVSIHLWSVKRVAVFMATSDPCNGIAPSPAVIMVEVIEIIAFSLLTEVFFFCVRWVDEYGRRDLCHGSKFTVLSIQLLSDRLLTSDLLCGLTLDNSGITVKECA